jgi:hypothetical protein
MINLILAIAVFALPVQNQQAAIIGLVINNVLEFAIEHNKTKERN